MAGGAKMHFHGLSRDLLTKWKKPIIIGLAAEITLIWGIYEAYYFNYHMNKNKYASVCIFNVILKIFIIL